MINSPRFKSPMLFLISEFVVIVLGVLTALGVDEWRNARQQENIRDQLIVALISDLEEDALDFEQVNAVAQERTVSCNMLLNSDFKADTPDRQTIASITDAFRLCNRYARLEPNETAFSEMTSNGTGLTISNTALRIKIMRYYSLARDRSDLNALFQITTTPYRNQLLSMGYAPSDVGEIDFQEVLNNPQLRASVKNIVTSLPYVIRVTDELIEANQALLAELKAIRADVD